MSIKRIFIVISAIFAASAVFADNSSVTSKKYVDDLMSGYQGKLPGSGANKLMIYDNSEDGIGEKSIEATLGNSASAVSVPTVGAVKTGLDGKQDTITGTAGYVMTGTGTPGDVGERAIYSANTNYTDSLVTAETVNSGVINAVNNSLIRVDENGAPSDSGTLWEINTSLLALDVRGYLPDGYTQLQYVDMNSGSYLLTDIVPTYGSKVEMDFQTTSLPAAPGYATFSGGRSETNQGAGLQLGYLSNQWVADGFTTGGRYIASVGPSANTRYKLIFNNKVTTLESGGSTVFTNTFTGTESNGAALAINAFNNAGSVVNNTAGIYLYSFKVWNPTGQLVANYIPATYNNTVGFYDTVSKTFKTATSGTFTAGPSCISPNLFDQTQQSPDKYYTATGSEAELYDGGVYFVHTGLIPCKPNTTYTVSGKRIASGNATIYAGAFFDENKQFISRDASTTPVFQNDEYVITYTTPANARYFAINKKANDTNVQIEQGSTATTYRPYGENICD